MSYVDGAGRHSSVTLGAAGTQRQLALWRLRGAEHLSKPFQYRLDLVSREERIPFSEAIGKPLSARIELADGSRREFNGIVARLSQGIPLRSDDDGEPLYHYTALLVPTLWRLSLASGCRVFQGKSVPEIVQVVLQERDVTDIDLALPPAAHPEQEYVVQYNESDLAFVSRLLERDGITYAFTHEKGRDALHVFDAAQGSPFADEQALAMRFRTSADGKPDWDEIESWSEAQSMLPGSFAVTDYNHEHPTADLLSTVSGHAELGGQEGVEHYESGTAHDSVAAGDACARLRVEASEAAANTIGGRGYCAGFQPGRRFSLAGHFRDRKDARPPVYLLTSVVHTYREDVGPGDGTHSYSCAFGCIPDDLPFRPPRDTPWLRIRGIQSAVVVGPQDEEIHVDGEGRIQVQFHWDREGEGDGANVCWTRVAQSHAGSSFGTVFTPRVGEEVVVSFVDGDPDRPLVVGSVYNGEHAAPFGHPASRTRSGIRSHSVGGTSSEYNEVSFDDAAGRETLLIHAQRDETIVVENDLVESVNRDRTRTVDRNELVTVHGDRDVHVENQTLSALSSVIINAGTSDTAAERQIELKVGDASIAMSADGTIEITGADIYLTGKNVKITSTDEFSNEAEKINVNASASHRITGAVVRQNC